MREPNPTSAFGREMQRRREDLHLSQRRAAQIASISESRWRQLEHTAHDESCLTTPTTVLVRKIAAALAWPLGEALTLAGYAADAVAPIPTQTDPTLAILADLLELTDRQQASVRNLVRSMRNPHNDDTLAEAS